MAVTRSGALPDDPLADAVVTAAKGAESSERERRLGPEVVDALASAGLFRMLVPQKYGGGEVEPAAMVDSIARVAQGDGAAAWCVAVACTSGALGAYLPEEYAREVFGPDARCWGGVFAPKGRGIVEGDSLRVTGRWPFTSGIDHCDWLMGGCKVEEEIRLVVFPASDAERIDTWDVAGLRGTGSHDMAVEDLVVPAARSASLITDAPREKGPLYAFPIFGLLSLAIASVALGIARGAMDDLQALAGSKTPSMGTRTLAARPDTQSRAARAETRLRAARALVDDAVGRAWAASQAEGAITLDHRAGLRMAASHAMTESAAVVDEAYSLAGGSAIYSSSPLQRRFRDVHTATQHMLVGPSVWELAGRLLLGVPADTEQL